MIAVHSQCGRHFLGLRLGRRGGYEIVYDGGPPRRRFIWHITSRNPCPEDVARQIHEAIRTAHVLETLYAGLRSAEIEFEIDHDRTAIIARG